MGKSVSGQGGLKVGGGTLLDPFNLTATPDASRALRSRSSLCRLTLTLVSSSPLPSSPQVQIQSLPPSRLLLFPQLFWAALLLLHSRSVEVYTSALQLLRLLLSGLDLSQTHVSEGKAGPQSKRGEKGTERVDA